jgi:hypothetical protein
MSTGRTNPLPPESRFSQITEGKAMALTLVEPAMPFCYFGLGYEG